MKPIGPMQVDPHSILTTDAHPRITDSKKNLVARLAHPTSEGPFATQTSFRLINSWIPKSESSLP
jgi:hypothetical protein